MENSYQDYRFLASCTRETLSIEDFELRWLVVAQLISLWIICLPQKPWFYDIWQTWVGYPFQVSFLALGHWPQGIPGTSLLKGVIHRSASQWAPPREVRHQSCLPFFGTSCWLLQDLSVICLCCNSALQPDHCYFHSPQVPSCAQQMLSVLQGSVQNP